MKLPKNLFKAALQAKEPLYGIWASMASGYVAEIVASFEYDWILIDGEHAPNTVPMLREQLLSVMSYRTQPIVRAVSGEAVLIKQLLDIGAQTLMIPMVETPEQAQELVRAMRYPPQGIRGAGGGLTRATRWDGIANYLHTAHEELCLIVQIESRKGVQQALQIAAIDGVDAVFIGPVDLSVDMGHPGNPRHPEVQEAIRSVINASRSAGKACGILAPAWEDAERYREWGCQFIAVAIDITLLRQAALANLAQYRPVTESTQESQGY